MTRRCFDCGMVGELTGHMTCLYPGEGQARYRRERKRKPANRETQQQRYLDCGPQAWDDTPSSGD